MPKFMTDGLLDGGLIMRGTMIRVSVLSEFPRSIEDIPKTMLAWSDVFPEDFRIQSVAPGQRVSVLRQFNNLPVLSDGIATHVVLDDLHDYEVHVCPPEQLREGSIVTIPELRHYAVLTDLGAKTNG